jgi:dTDP-L-rhamnose 4-epimerase
VSAVLVTGGAGFIGSHLVDALLAAGEEVRILDNLDPLAHPSGQPPAHLDPAADLRVGDLRDPEDVLAALDGVDRVFHLGGIVGNGESMVNVRKAIDANAGGTATLLEGVIARRDRIRRVVVASSMVVYGEGAYRCSEHGVVTPGARPAAQLRERRWEPLCPRCERETEPVPLTEDKPLQPISVYGISKRDSEELALVLGEAYGFEAVALRYLNVYGPRQALANPYTGVAAIFASRLLGGAAPRVFEDGHQIRDLVHVSDIVAATRAAMDAPGAPGRAFNVATGRRIEIGDLAARLCALLAPGTEPEITGEFRAGDIRHCFADASRARDRLGFEARTTLEDGLPELVEWVARQTVTESGDAALEALRRAGLVG